MTKVFLNLMCRILCFWSTLIYGPKSTLLVLVGTSLETFWSRHTKFESKRNGWRDLTLKICHKNHFVSLVWGVLVKKCFLLSIFFPKTRPSRLIKSKVPLMAKLFESSTKGHWFWFWSKFWKTCWKALELFHFAHAKKRFYKFPYTKLHMNFTEYRMYCRFLLQI